MTLSRNKLDGKTGIPETRLKMKPWLMEQLNRKPPVPGLAWLNQRDRTFRVSWRHAARHGWNPSVDADLFERWARHTGKFNDGKSHDPKRWKANFRCALHSLPGVVQLREKGLRKGQNAFKVYQFLDEKRARKIIGGSNHLLRRKKKVRKSKKLNLNNYSYDSYEDEDGDSSSSGITSDYSSTTSERSPIRQISESSNEDLSVETIDWFNSDPNVECEQASHTAEIDANCLPDFDKICDLDIEVADRHAVTPHKKALTKEGSEAPGLTKLLLCEFNGPDAFFEMHIIEDGTPENEIPLFPDDEQLLVDAIYDELKPNCDGISEYPVLNETDSVRTEGLPGCYSEGVSITLNYQEI